MEARLTAYEAEMVLIVERQELQERWKGLRLCCVTASGDKPRHVGNWVDGCTDGWTEAGSGGTS